MKNGRALPIALLVLLLAGPVVIIKLLVGHKPEDSVGPAPSVSVRPDVPDRPVRPGLPERPRVPKRPPTPTSSAAPSPPAGSAQPGAKVPQGPFAQLAAMVGSGQALVLSAKLDESGEWDIYRIVGGEPQVQNLTADFRGNAYRPRLSPDRGHVAFLGEVAEEQQLWVMTSSGAERRPVESRRGRFGPDLRDWYDDRTLVYYYAPERGKGFIRTVDIDGAGDRVLIHSPFRGQHNFGDVRLSPDRKLIALLAQQGSWGPTHDLYLVDADGKSNPKAFYEDPGDSHDDAFVLWTHEGTEIYWMHYQESGPGQKRPAVVKKSVRSPEPKYAFDEVVRPASKDASALLAISPDDAQLLIRDGPGGSVVAFDIGTKQERPVLAVPAIGRMDWR